MVSTLKKHTRKIALAKELIKTAKKTKIKRKKVKDKNKKTKSRKTRTTVYTNLLGKTLKISF